jgi:hypothetical protein
MIKVMRVYGKNEMVAEVIRGYERDVERAEAAIRALERRDRYEVEVERYPMPRSWEGEYPTYYLVKNGRRI